MGLCHSGTSASACVLRLSSKSQIYIVVRNLSEGDEGPMRRRGDTESVWGNSEGSGMIGEVGTQHAQDKSGRLRVTTKRWSSTQDNVEYSSILEF